MIDKIYWLKLVGLWLLSTELGSLGGGVRHEMHAQANQLTNQLTVINTTGGIAGRATDRFCLASSLLMM